MLKKVLYRWVGNILLGGINAYAVANWIRGAGVLIWENIGWPEYVITIFICTGLLIFLNWIWIVKLLPCTRFKELEPLITDLDKSRGSGWVGYFSSADKAKMLELCDRLDGLRIKHPVYIYSEECDSTEWDYFLPILLSDCRQGKLRSVRNKWSSVFDEDQFFN